MTDQRLQHSRRKSLARGTDPRERSAHGQITQSMLGPGLILDGDKITLNWDPDGPFYNNERGEAAMRVGDGLVVEPGSPNTLKAKPADSSVRATAAGLSARPKATQVDGVQAAIAAVVAVGVAPKGASVTQGISKANPVTIDTRAGKITMNAGVIASMASVAFTVNCSECGPDDIPVVSVRSGGTSGAYLVSVGATAKGSFEIVVFNCSGGPLNEILVLNYRLERGAEA